jgi:quercetin dioxygenase-like cupin family protein
MRPKRPSGASSFPTAHLRAEALPRPVAAMADSLAAGTAIPPHAHRRAQLIFAVSGAMTVRAAESLWMLPASHALWVPPAVVHEIRVVGPVELRTLYVQERHAERIGGACRILFVSPLLRELIVRAVTGA